MSLVLRVEIEKESEGRWIADVVNMPGVMVYGRSPKEAFRSAQALALEVIADRLKHGENPLTGKRSASPPFRGVEFSAERQAALAR
jgi:predicted RNase H-like HicB family nuclease